MSNELISLSTLFQNRLFRIPDYQRGYAWKKEQLVDFWEDLLNLHEDRYHYTGLLSLKAVNKESLRLWGEDSWLIDIGYKAYHVVDGQQRLTTFSILMYEIISFIKRLDENQEKSDDQIFIGFESVKAITEKYIMKSRPPENMIKTYMFGYELDNPSYNYLKHKIFEEQFGGTIVETYYTQNLMYAKKFFARNLESLFEAEGMDGIEKLYKRLTLKLMFNLHEIEDDYDVFVAFETMNNRGKKLSNLELLKNRLIYLTTLFDDEQLDDKDKGQLRKNINDAWKEVYYQLGRNQNHPLADDEFLRAHWTVYFQYTRRKGDDYIKFLLNKFSSKNVFDKHPVTIDNEIAEPQTEDEDFDDEDVVENTEEETILVSKLAPSEINAYVSSLKEIAEYWYYTYFPHDSDELSAEEKQWINKLNRIGIGYFRPLVAISLSLKNEVEAEERVLLFKEIERFIFLCFRMAGYNASYKSSYYYNKARDVLHRKTSLKSVADDLMETIDNDLNPIITSFIARTDRRFDSGLGFYGWRDLRYFLYEYESHLSTKNNIQKIDWQMFSKVEKDKITIEHILPQTPTKWYWRNQFRHFNEEEIKILSASLGNLLPLAQSINSSLQNDSFPDKKNPSSKRRGYINGSHSEIEVAIEEDWTPEAILNRGLKLLEFMENRWGLDFTVEQKNELLHIDFVNEERDEVPEIPEPTTNGLPETDNSSSFLKEGLTALQQQRLNFWRSFVDYCKSIDRGKDIASQKPAHVNWYDVAIGNSEYYIFFQIMKQNILRIGIYVHQPETFKRLELLRNEIESMYGSELEWYTSRKTSTAKRILHSIETDVFNPELYLENFNWLISQYDKLKSTLEVIDVASILSVDNANNSSITSEMVAYAYDVSKKVFEGKLGRTEGRDEIADRVNMNSGSAGDYISAFYAMMNGERYTRTLNEYSTRYFLKAIYEDYGELALKKAIDACRKHATYYAALGRGRLAYVEKIVEEYSN
jgi:hypothetical protein